MTSKKGSPIAAPPDDGSHRGSYSRPDEELQTGDDNAPERGPYLHYIDRHPAPQGRFPGLGSIVILIIGSLLLFLAVFYAYLP